MLDIFKIVNKGFTIIINLMLGCARFPEIFHLNAKKLGV